MEASADAAARTLRWAGRPGHLGGVPRAAVIGAIGTVAKAYVTLLNTTTVHNADALHRLVKSRPPGTPLLTVSNHMSTYVTCSLPPLLPFAPCITLLLVVA
jgi:monolysocardiolipin acyltransferase